MTAGTPRLLLAACFLLFAAWSLVVPINEAPDEPAHWQYARYLHDHWRLPHYAPGFEEANSPPLAYLLFAPFAAEEGGPDMALAAPDPGGGVVSLVAPRLFLNADTDYGRFWRQRAARLLAAAISVGTVFFTWRAGLAAGGPDVARLAALIAALLPMFAFRAGHVSNDALVACASAAATWGLVRLVREPFAWPVAWWTSAAIAVAYLSKISAIALVPPFALALVVATPAVPWPARLARLAALALAAVIVAPWSIRNVVLYGDPVASEAMRTAVAHIITDRPLLSPFFVDEFPRVLTKSFIGIFGWANLVMPPMAYRPYVAFFAIGLAGVAFSAWRRRIDWRLPAVLIACGLASLAVVVRINLQFTQMQGRYLLTALPAFAVLVGLGLRALPLPAALRAPNVVGGALLAGNLYALCVVVWPAYHPAPIRTLPSGERTVVPSLLADMTAGGHDQWIVTGGQPWWLAHVDADAIQFAALEVELTASATPAAQRACLAPTAGVTPGPDEPASCVDWIADGRPRRVRFPLRGLSSWTGVVTHLRLEPFAAGAVPAGTTVWIRDARLSPAPAGAAPPAGTR